VVWWGSLIEVHSAICRLHRENAITDIGQKGAVARLRLLSLGWREILPGDEIRELATQLLDKYPLRAADSQQLAAVLDLVRTTSIKENLHLRGPPIVRSRRVGRILGPRIAERALFTMKSERQPASSTLRTLCVFCVSALSFLLALHASSKPTSRAPQESAFVSRPVAGRSGSQIVRLYLLPHLDR